MFSHSLDTSFLPSTTRGSRFILCFLYPSPRISLFSKDSISILMFTVDSLNSATLWTSPYNFLEYIPIYSNPLHFIGDSYKPDVLKSDTTKLLLFWQAIEVFLFPFQYQKRYLFVQYSVVIKHSITWLICHFRVEKYEWQRHKNKTQRSESQVY